MEQLTRKSAAFLAHYSGLNAVRRRCSRALFGPALTVLAYHRVNDSPLDDSLFTVSPAQFEEHCAYVSDRYNVITFAEALAMKADPVQARDALVITFDDGYRDNFTNAAAILARYGLKACFFLTTDLVETAAPTHANSTDRLRFPGMTWTQVKALYDEGFELGAHTCSHPNLSRIPLAAARCEMVESKRAIEKVLGTRVRYFAYPGGKRRVHYSDDVKREAAKEFDLCCTTARGRNSFRTMDPLEVRRICVQRWWSPFYFARELEGTFDFVGSAGVCRRKR